MVETVISIRPARLGDEGDIAKVHDEAWREAYRGVIPGRELERMIARRGPTWWRMAIARRTPLLVLEYGDSVVGYVSYGRNRVPALSYGGEIFELYVAPECQGCDSDGVCSRPRARIWRGTDTGRSWSGRWPIMTGRSASTVSSAVGWCGARMRLSAVRSENGSLSALVEAVSPL